MLDQLTQLHGRNYVIIGEHRHPYSISSIYWSMESVVQGKVKTKQFKNSKSKLFGKGILHIHHGKAFYLEMNNIRHFKMKYKTNEQVEKRVEELKRERPNCNPIWDLVYESLMESMDWDRKTGEWILFQKNKGKLHFIGLGLHDSSDIDDQKLYDNISDYIREDF